ncbi:MAG: hypothetical protein R3B49_10190 [Phycisphaerales bacterium]
MVPEDRAGDHAEYILLAGVNDRSEHAAELASLCTAAPTSTSSGTTRSPGLFDALVRRRPRVPCRVLRTRGVNAHIRASAGRDIAAACGQLRHEHA